jgi:cytochrome c-type biogenesis protein CcmH
MMWVLFALLLAATLAILLAPLLKRRPKTVARAEYDRIVYKDQLAEIDRELERGTLSADQADSARTEIQRRILSTGDRNEAAEIASPRRLAGLVAALAVGVPAAALGLYAVLGSPQVPDLPYAARTDQFNDAEDQSAMVARMVAQLAAKLEKDPNDGKGWAKLGRSLRVLNQPAKAKEAYARAARLMPGDTQVRMEYADLLLDDVPQGAPLPAEFVGVMREIVAVDPKNPDALYFLGISEMQMGNKIKARDYWTRLIVLLPEGSEDRATIQKQVDALR